MQYLSNLVGRLYVFTSVICAIANQSAPNSNSIAQVDDYAVRFLGISRNSFCLLSSDAAKYMVAARAKLKSLYSKLFRAICVAHLFHS